MGGLARWINEAVLVKALDGEGSAIQTHCSALVAGYLLMAICLRCGSS